MTEGQGQPLKFTITHYRKPQHTHEEFIKWIVEGHLPLAISVFNKHRILGYTLLEAVKDEEHWVDTSKALATLGYATQYLLPNGETVNLPK
ncbi:hypothetical protein VC83_01370 [Pseudogymnoascus destructans]|uniref:EthD domain-containing protein n=1 Tax=Pseudogymnoascus destructans TaxID=655981 RepID=A0A177AJ11_9PEZI|nr:uncharacterized protein VC83_01370 [Pseudogymnoascus destructans]OAF62057.1 hypothetical protein VC83_01370 [Pseudogymnoascus destructans]